MSRSPEELKFLLKERGLAANKGLGQNFLLDERVLDRIAEVSEVSFSDSVLEIGPGPGALTERLVQRAGRVVAIELDRGMCGFLAEHFNGCKNLEIVHEDVLKADLEKILGLGCPPGKKWKVIANLPYYISTPVLFKIFQYSSAFESLTVMLQKEVAERLQASPGGKSYGALSLSAQYYADIQIAFEVSPGAFWPQPKVYSAVVKLSPYEKPPIISENTEAMFSVIRAAFSKRRKTLANALSGVSLQAENGIVSKEETEKVLAEMGLDPRIRGEVLSLAEYAALTDRLMEKMQGRI
ncbi:MAG: 16S rRNA (adenine(1518)-N(6)/adenine(1519)-N(6))-dimethyltransferase RsmA [Lachnospiraceae bacterium]|nr:16S rRNA (adenine(1518)-N(6)/adenine(1519)-N(6))-dimethyltransferase RsmA [Lachnospiraceae bacterium]